MRVNDMVSKCLAHIARHVIGRHSPQATRIQDTFDDRTSIIRKALTSGGPSAPKEIILPTTTMNIPKEWQAVHGRACRLTPYRPRINPILTLC